MAAMTLIARDITDLVVQTRPCVRSPRRAEETLALQQHATYHSLPSHNDRLGVSLHICISVFAKINQMLQFVSYIMTVTRDVSYNYTC